VLERFRLTPGEAIYIGDREENCLDAARRAGLRTIRYDPGGDPSQPDVLASWSALPDRIQGELG
jgi:FMN phosphatase YigB (HAD superfamily)